MEKALQLILERGAAEMAGPDGKRVEKSRKGIRGYIETVASAVAIIVFLWYFIKPAASNMIREIVSSEIEEASVKITSDINPKLEKLGEDIEDVELNVQQIIHDFYKPYGPAFSSDLTPAEDFVHYATLSYITQDSPIKENNATFLSSKSFVAYSMVADEAYTVEQVADERLFLPYIEDGQEIYFLGQLSTNGNWDGNCIINIYKNDELQLITDAMYDDGELLTCKQIFPYTTTNDKIDVWAVSKRTAKNEFSSGETLYFVREGEYIKQFAFETAHAEDVLSVNDFKQFLTGYQEGYYYGNTSNGQFNDDTSTAYMVKYFPDGTVKTLYVGKFQNGQFEDDSGNAWLIGKKEMGAPYYYYHEGPFENGEMIKDPKYWDKGISQQEINKLIKGYSFNCNLNWG